ncbi:site-specific recombinase XerD [Desulfosporosinus orientis DSM 765]|uniref:Site-specific recombinase XerD n=1 Tax=Desulfosporosinus orientis (strain ATCC 19365 / DSM 765 / NCIMB 8382 / VKM B-1628 / Singapore I) TaxID=768706 RepID=G7W5H1_DESOD|nr:site-specific integrase [Desulfosporosinus orientis]AET66618.1 site-specific recombinase XerD [Desulfosporosinus orientis DSM 765]
MYIIEEKLVDGEPLYIKRYKAIDSNNDYEERIYISQATISRDNNDYIMIYDNKTKVIRDAFRYLNSVQLLKKPINSRLSISSSLKRLYEFLTIFQYDINNLGVKEVAQLKDFLYGGKKAGISYEFKFVSMRNADTINQYLSKYRKYLKFLNISNETINERQNSRNLELSQDYNKGISEKIQERYVVSDPSQQNKRTVPRYISEAKFESIILYIKKKYSLREEIIVRLMFENGLRLGETLGLTLEDVEDTLITIRNRLTDKKDQHAKTCYHPKNVDDYKRSIYSTWGKGYQTIKPKLLLINKIQEYIDISHGKMSSKKRANYLCKAKADKVTNGASLEGDNYYLFLNKDGKPLAQDGWNKILRDIFNKTGIDIDEGVRKHNLSHRFRHGFAMKIIKEGAEIFEVAKALRHSNVASVMCYFRPTEEDVYDANKMGAEAMIKQIPELEI